MLHGLFLAGVIFTRMVGGSPSSPSLLGCLQKRYCPPYVEWAEPNNFVRAMGETNYKYKSPKKQNTRKRGHKRNEQHVSRGRRS